MPKLLSGAEIVFKVLEDRKVDTIFGYPGGAVLPIYDELKNHKSIKHILARHEQELVMQLRDMLDRAVSQEFYLLPQALEQLMLLLLCRCLYGLSSFSLHFWPGANTFNWN